MWVYLRDVIYENRFHNCVRESEKALLVAVSADGIAADHEHGNRIEQHSKQYSFLISDFSHILVT